jgi:hypothetical protein
MVMCYVTQNVIYNTYDSTCMGYPGSPNLNRDEFEARKKSHDIPTANYTIKYHTNPYFYSLFQDEIY